MSKFEITLQDIFWSIKKYFIWILLTTVVFTAGAWVYSSFFVTPLYRIRVTMVVFSGNRSGSGVTTSDLTADARLANTYRLLLTNSTVTKAVSDAMPETLALPASTISGMISTSSVSDTQLIYAYVTSENPQIAKLVADTLAEVAPAAVSQIARGGEMVAVDEAALPSAPISPNIASNVSLGFILGLLLSCAVVILIAVLNTTIWREEDIARVFDAPVLGSVPSMTLPSGVSAGRKRR